MTHCRAVRKNFVAWIDRELPPRWNDRIERHLVACTACSAEAEDLRAAIEWQRRALLTTIAVGELDAARLHTQVQRAIGALSEAGDPWWNWVLRPVAVTSGALAVVTVLVVLAVGGPRAILISLGLQSPPAEMARQPELFTEYPLIQHLDALENFDVVDSMPVDVDDEQARQSG